MTDDYNPIVSIKPQLSDGLNTLYIASSLSIDPETTKPLIRCLDQADVSSLSRVRVGLVTSGQRVVKMENWQKCM